ncbi:hypothetical protein B0O80DRAFT_242982 [Mortierella sp. GBAus27b]|nr:hypothetical protein BGX31_009614 [Mortierella sp. GBA43]KAI8346455.1 hypothetical protein B0O80DRAFT_242982 [Mortierella sp. GBAus27b]
MARLQLTTLFLLAFLATLINALPTTQPPSKASPFRFEITAPVVDTLWLVDSLPTVSWDTTQMPEGSTLDIALLHHEKKQSILLRRYVPSHSGAALVNLLPEVVPGTYSLLLTVYKGRTSTVVGRSLVQSVILVEEEGTDPEQETVQRTDSKTPAEDNGDQKSAPRKTEMTEFSFKKKNQNAIQESEQVKLTHQPTRGNVVLRAPYTVGWTIPKALKNARHVRVNILLVSRSDEVVRTLATNVDAKAGFMYVFLPEDVPLGMYSIKIEIIGKGRKFTGRTHKFQTSLPAFAAKK